MSRIRAKNTKPEMLVRSLLHKQGYRFRLHQHNLPGKPDICLPKYKTVIFVHGCFWHAHENCKRSNIPKSNTDYWIPKIMRNVERDLMHRKSLKNMEWKVIVIWECELKNLEELREKLTKGL